jgi:chemotaxis protein histidine kinase CheA
LVLLLGTAFVNAQEEPKKEPPKRGATTAKQGAAQKAKEQEKKPAEPAGKPAQPAQPPASKPAQPPAQRTQPPANQPPQNTAQPAQRSQPPANQPAQNTAQPTQRTQPRENTAQPAQRTQPPNQPAQNVAQPNVTRPPEAAPRTPRGQTERPVQQPQQQQQQQQAAPPTATPRYQPQQQPQNRQPAENQNRQPGQRGNRADAGAQPVRAGAPGRVVTTRGGDIVRHDQSGQVSEVHMKSGAVVYHAPTGLRRMEVARPGGRVVVVDAPGHGYVQSQIVVSNRPMVKRTYYMNGVSYARMYRPVTYRGLAFQIYTPVRYYRPTFYGYLFNPWARPVMWDWGWSASPWYGYYGGYFRPYRYYSSPLLWLTDYLVAATLEEAYQERLAENLAPAPMVEGDVALTPEVKQLIADEVRRQIDQEQAESRSINTGSPYGDAPAWADNSSHVFVAYTALGVNSSLGYCTISEGDVLQMYQAPRPDDAAANVVVLAGRRQDCRKGSTVAVRLEDLQDMDNHMRETVEAGLGDLQSHQGQSGIPPLPAGAAGTIDTPYAADATPDPNASAELNQAYQDTNQAERAALGQAANDATAPTPTVSLGQSIDQVRAILGPPQQIMDAGAKQIYVYRNVKITFINGRVSDIQ